MSQHSWCTFSQVYTWVFQRLGYASILASSVNKEAPYFAPGSSFSNNFLMGWDSAPFDAVAMFSTDCLHWEFCAYGYNPWSRARLSLRCSVCSEPSSYSLKAEAPALVHSRLFATHHLWCSKRSSSMTPCCNARLPVLCLEVLVLTVFPRISSNKLYSHSLET